MTGVPTIAVVAGILALALGVPVWLYVRLTKRRRRTMREIRSGAAERGWKFRIRHWTGDPMAFRIDGQSRSGMRVVVKSSGTRGYDRGWTVVLGLGFPEMAGEVDVVVLPRRLARKDSEVMMAASPEIQERVAAFSGMAVSEIALMRDGREMPSGLTEFDAAYHVLTMPGESWQTPIDAGLAKRFLKWPRDAIAPHSIVVWRDAFGLHVQARLPGPANWATICYVVELGEDVCGRVPAGKMTGTPKGLLERIVQRVRGKE
jgi:hypothetical protein